MPIRDLPPFRDLGAFVRHLAAKSDLRRISEPVSLVHDMTEVHRRVLRAGGPALMFERALAADGSAARMPVLVNLFGTRERVAAGLGVLPGRVGELGALLAQLRSPEPVNGLRDALSRWPLVRAALATRPDIVASAPAQEIVLRGGDIDLGGLPIQTCWPGEPAPLITWPLVLTRPPEEEQPTQYNAGVYRMQALGRDRAIMRWLHHRGGARHHAAWANEGRETPVVAAIGADPATVLAAVLPLPENVSEITFAGLLRGERPRLARAISVPMLVPADAEIVIEGWVSPNETAPEGPFGDHTGYYNAVEPFPVMRITAITTKREPIYLSTFTGRPPDEPSVIGSALNDLVLPIIRGQFPEIADCWLPPDACSYRMAIIAIRKRYPGHAARIMMGLWGMLPQFSYTKTIIVVDDDIDPRRWEDVAWAIATRFDPSRDLTVIERSPIDYLDFASPASGLGGKLGIDATTKIGAETSREWGRVLKMTPEVERRVDQLWPRLGIDEQAKAAE